MTIGKYIDNFRRRRGVAAARTVTKSSLVIIFFGAVDHVASVGGLARCDLIATMGNYDDDERDNHQSYD